MADIRYRPLALLVISYKIVVNKVDDVEPTFRVQSVKTVGKITGIRKTCAIRHRQTHSSINSSWIDERWPMRRRIDFILLLGIHYFFWFCLYWCLGFFLTPRNPIRKSLTCCTLTKWKISVNNIIEKEPFAFSLSLALSLLWDRFENICLIAGVLSKRRRWMENRFVQRR